jgi:hypothetical protein
MSSNFVQLCLDGNALLEEIYDFVDEWHENPRGEELHKYLGMTKEEYALWVQVPDLLSYIIKARRDNATLTRAVTTAYEDFRLAARSNEESKVMQLQRWLKARGNIR